jgi:hypothetical protein
MRFPPQAWLFVALVGCGSIVPAAGDAADAAAAPERQPNGPSKRGASAPVPMTATPTPTSDQAQGKGPDKQTCEKGDPPCDPGDGH